MWLLPDWGEFWERRRQGACLARGIRGAQNAATWAGTMVKGGPFLNPDLALGPRFEGCRTVLWKANTNTAAKSQHPIKKIKNRQINIRKLLVQPFSQDLFISPQQLIEMKMCATRWYSKNCVYLLPATDVASGFNVLQTFPVALHPLLDEWGVSGIHLQVNTAVFHTHKKNQNSITNTAGL